MTQTFTASIPKLFQNQASSTIGLFALIALLVWGVYYPGLTGSLMLDDMANLPPLFESIKYDGFWYAVFNGFSGPLGRPISLFSFAIQHHDLKAPYAYKLVNVILHIINTGLIFWLARLIVEKVKFISEKHRLIFAGAVALIWASLPIQVSSVLYVVQRMVLLMSMFVLMGIIAHIYSRKHLVTGNNIILSYVLLSISLGIFGLLAVFSKETGLLLVLYLLTLEILYKDEQPRNTRPFMIWKMLFLVMPALLFVGYLALRYNEFLIGYEKRPFTLEERILTQPLILWDYIQQILFPRLSQLGLYHDNFQFSTGLFSPLSTAIALFGLIAVFVVSIATRKRYAVFAFAILWFLAGHSMESSIIPLELYFEHRNYLPSFSIIFGVVTLFFYLASHVKSDLIAKAFFSLIILFIFLTLGLTFQQSRLWGDPVEYGLVQAKEHPESIRARSLMIDLLSRANQLDMAYEEAKKIALDFPTASTVLLPLNFSCINERFPVPDIHKIKAELRQVKYDIASVKIIADIVQMIIEEECPAVTPDYAHDLILTLKAKSGYESRASAFAIHRSLLYLHNNDIIKAIQVLEEEENLSYIGRIHLARLLATTGELHKALEQLDKAEKLTTYSLSGATKKGPIEELRNTIKDDLINTGQQSH